MILFIGFITFLAGAFGVDAALRGGVQNGAHPVAMVVGLISGGLGMIGRPRAHPAVKREGRRGLGAIAE